MQSKYFTEVKELALSGEVTKYAELKEKEKSINDAWEKLSDLQSKQTEIGNRMNEYENMFDYF